MQILSNSNCSNPAFSSNLPSKGLNTVNAVMKRFEKDVSNPRSQLKDVDKLRLVMKNLLKGIKAECLAENFGLSLSKIYAFSTKYNTHKVYIRNRNNIILKRLLNGDKREKIAKDMDVDLRTVQIVADKYNTFNVVRQNRDKLIVEMFEKGLMINDIAKNLNINSITVRRTLKMLGLK